MQNVNHTEFPVAFRMLLQEEGKKFDIGDSGKFLKKKFRRRRSCRLSELGIPLRKIS